ncbi:UDP-glucuronate 4-epimerase [Sphingomonas zeicaulis]|uniref:SDR family NAD(P)-dependent oxidoreductase n=1 Tax=Sphingomonas zeicaulis TaxID=1632740 RepID=UPI003D2461FA
MAFLVTGAAGFIGHHVASRLLARGERVIGIDNLNPYYAVSLKRDRLGDLTARCGDAFRFVEADFADEDALEAAVAGVEIEGIVHLGAQAGVRHSLQDPRAYVRANVMGHLNLLELARARRPRHMVYASSSSVYGGNIALPFSVADRTDNPVSLYAATKRADELMSESYAHLYRLPLTGLRFFTVYGPWGRPDMAMWIFTSAILEGRPIRVSNGGRVQRDFTYIDDIVAGVIACLDSPPSDDGAPKPGGSLGPHRIYNVGNHRAEPLDEVIALIERNCGRAAIREAVPLPPGDVAATFADIDAISADHGYRPTTTIAEGVPRFVDWFRQYHGV